MSGVLTLAGISSPEFSGDVKRPSDVLALAGWIGSGCVLGDIVEKKVEGEKLRLRKSSPS